MNSGVLLKNYSLHSHRTATLFSASVNEEGIHDCKYYILKVKANSKNMSAAGQLISDKEPFFYILVGVRSMILQS